MRGDLLIIGALAGAVLVESMGSLYGSSNVDWVSRSPWWVRDIVAEGTAQLRADLRSSGQMLSRQSDSDEITKRAIEAVHVRIKKNPRFRDWAQQWVGVGNDEGRWRDAWDQGLVQGSIHERMSEKSW